MEIWKDVPNYEGLYKVSNVGNVKSLKYGKERILKPTKNKWGYLQVNLYKNGKYKRCSVHRLLALTFLPNPENLPCVNHKDENSLNNCLYNLEWCDSKYNINYGSRNQRMVSTRNKNGSINAEKPVLQLSKDGIKINIYKSTIEAERQTGIPQTNICRCCKGKLKSCGGFVWKYL